MGIASSHGKHRRMEGWKTMETNSVSDPLNLKYHGHCYVENCKFRWNVQEIRAIDADLEVIAEI